MSALVKPALPLQEDEDGSLSETLYGSLREKVLSGSLPPGSELRQELIARQFGVSRVPVREAMNRLQAEGLIVRRPRRGFVVTSLDIPEIIEIFELRMVLEQHAIDTATRLRTEADVRAVEELLLAMEAVDPASETFVSDWLDINRSFHGRLIASARRHRLAGITANLRDTIEPYVRIESFLTADFTEATLEHRELFAAFRECAPNRAGALSRDHCLSTMNRLLDGIRRREMAVAVPFRKKPRSKQ
jgi:DNA-binding GntR family transcriptional regulator